MDLYYAYPAQPPTTAGEELDDLDRDLYDLSEVRAFLTVGAPQPLQLMSQPTIVSLDPTDLMCVLFPILFVGCLPSPWECVPGLFAYRSVPRYYKDRLD